MVSSLIFSRSLCVYILKQLFFSISVNSGFRNIYLAASPLGKSNHCSPRFQRIIVKYSFQICMVSTKVSGRTTTEQNYKFPVCANVGVLFSLDILSQACEKHIETRFSLQQFWSITQSCHASVRLRAVSLFSWSVEQNARDTQMTTRVTEGARRERLPPSFLASRGFAAQRSRARALPLLNLKKKRDCSQSMLQCTECYLTKTEPGIRFQYLSLIKSLYFQPTDGRRFSSLIAAEVAEGRFEEKHLLFAGYFIF